MKKRASFSIGICLSVAVSMAMANGKSPDDIPLFGRFEIQITNNNHYENPFMDVDLNSVFTSPDGTEVNYFGFYDGDGKGGQNSLI